MTRIALGVLAASVLLLLPATAQGDSSVRVRGTVTLKDSAAHIVTLRATRQAVALRVPGSLAAIRVGQRVELRGSTLRAKGGGSRVLARNVTIASSAPLSAAPQPKADEEVDEDEVEIKGELLSLTPLTVRSSTRTVTCAVPAGQSVTGFAIGDFVEITCDLRAGAWVLRNLEHEDDEDRADRDDDHRGHSGSGDDDDDDDEDGDDDSGHSGSGSGDDD
ncbi:MAG TPA: hypothetical protein VFU99_03480 [Gaiellaceae bacterium]|nr:hypothetical protein [Gaiellaceae bacterium]